MPEFTATLPGIDLSFGDVGDFLSNATSSFFGWVSGPGSVLTDRQQAAINAQNAADNRRASGGTLSPQQAIAVAQGDIKAVLALNSATPNFDAFEQQLGDFAKSALPNVDIPLPKLDTVGLLLTIGGLIALFIVYKLVREVL